MANNDNALQYSKEQRVFVVCNYMELSKKRRKFDILRERFAAQFENHKLPCNNTIRRLVRKFRAKHTVDNLPKVRPVTAATPDVVNSVLDAVRRDQDVCYDEPVNTCRRNELNLTKSTWNRILKSSDLKCYR